jgi:hypothetical protein
MIIISADASDAYDIALARILSIDAQLYVVVGMNRSALSQKVLHGMANERTLTRT